MLSLIYLFLRGGTENESSESACQRPPLPVSFEELRTAGFEPPLFIVCCKAHAFVTDGNYRARVERKAGR